MPTRNKPLAEIVPELFPEKWPDAPAERSKKIDEIKKFLRAESASPLPETFADQYERAFTRGLFKFSIGSYRQADWGLEWLGEQFNNLWRGFANVQVASFFGNEKTAFLYEQATGERWPYRTKDRGIFSILSDIWDAVKYVYNTVSTFTSWIWQKGIAGIKAFFNVLWDFISDPIGTIQSAIRGIWNSLVSVGSALWDVITDAAKGAVNAIWGSIKNALGGAWDAIKNFGESVWNAAKGALEAVIDPLWSILEGIKGFFSDIWNTLKDVAGWISDIPTKLWNGLMTVADWIKQIPGKIWKGLQELGGWIKQIPGKIWQGLKQLGTWIYEGLSAVFGWLQEEAWPWFVNTMDALWSAVQSGVNWIAGRIMDTFHAVIHAFANFAHIITDAIAGGLKKVMTIITRPLADFFQWTMQTLVMAPLRGLRGEGGTLPGIPTLVDTVGEISEELYTTLRDGIEYEPPATFEKAQDAAGDFLTYGLVFGGMDSIVGMAEEIWDKLRGFAGGVGSDIVNKLTGYAETVNPFQQYPKAISGSTASHFGGIAKFFKSTYYALGLGFMMWTIWSGSLRAIMADPREEHYRRVYKTKYPTPSEFRDAFEVQLTLPTSNEGWLDTAGYNPMYRDMIEQMSWKRLRESEIEEWYERGYIKEGELWDYIKWLGYEPQIANMKVEHIKEGVREGKRDDIIDAVQDGYQDGIFDREAAKQRLTAQGYNDLVSRWFTYALDIETQIEDAQEFIDAIDEGFDEKLDALADSFEDGEISREEFESRRRELEDSYRHRLGSYMRRPDRVEAKIMYWKNKNLPERIPIAVKPLPERIEDVKQEIENKKAQREYMVARRTETRETYEARANVIKERMSADARSLAREIERTGEEMDRDLRAERADYSDDVATAVAVESTELADAVEVPWTAVVNRLQVEPDPELPAPTLTDEFFRERGIPIPPSAEERADVAMGLIVSAIEAQAPALIDRIRTDITTIKEEHVSEIKELQAELRDIEPLKVARINELQEEKEDKLLYYDNRVSVLEREIENESEELEALKRVKAPAS